ncbi:MAG: GAF domain-containing protein, partial [Acidobacteriota bacterium]|nr:GAF domain-containing protein [Acidobacteriota bacterium]
LYEPKRTRLRLLESRNFSPCAARLIEEYRPGVDRWKAAVFEKRKPVFTSYRCLVSRYADTRDERRMLLSENIKALGIVPMIHDDQVVGTLDIGSRSRGTFTTETKHDILELAQDTGDTLYRILTTSEEREAGRAREHMLSIVTEKLAFHKKEWEIGTVLGILGESLDIDRAYVYKFRDGHARMDNTHEWCAPGVESHKPMLQDLDTGLYPWWIARLQANEVTRIADVGSLPPEAGLKREIYKALGIRSALFVPIFVDGSLWGCIGFDQVFYHRDWSDEDVRTIRIVARLFEDAIHRKRLTEQLLRQNEALQARTQELEDYAHSLFHDAQSPLVSIYSYAELIKEYADTQGDQELKGLVAVIEKNTIVLSDVARKLGLKVRESNR